MTRERPILFSGEMVRAILDGRKKQTRRVVSRRLTEAHGDPVQFAPTPTDPHELLFSSRDTAVAPHVLVPVRFHVGDRLWVRETWCLAHPEHLDDVGARPTDGRPANNGQWCYYAASDPDVEGGDGRSPWRPSIYMPRWASRIALEVTAVRLQQLQDISEDDARAEGVCICDAATAKQSTVDTYSMTPHVGAFAALWESINGKRAPWASNPWVWAISFEVVS